MFSAINQTPPEIALALGFFIALSLRQGRLAVVVDMLLPTDDQAAEDTTTDAKDTPRGRSR